MDLLQPMMIAALLQGGMGVALLGSVKVALARRLGIDEARVGGLVSLFGFAMIPVIFAAGFLTDQVGQQEVLVCGCVLFAAGMLVLGQAKSYPSALAGVVLFSAAWAMVINVGNVLTPLAFPAADTAFATNLANVFFGLGAFCTPLAVAWLIGRASLMGAMAVLAGLALVPAALSIGVDFDALNPTSAGEAPGLSILLGDPILWLCGLALFFYGPLEASMAAWATTYLGDQGVPEKSAVRLLSGFWLAFMAARLITAFALPELIVALGLSKQAMWTVFILALGLVCIALFLAMVTSRSRGLAMLLVVLAGFVFGPIFPTLMAVLLEHVPSPLHGRAVGFLFAIGGWGWTLIPLFIGAYARRTSVQRAFTIAMGAAGGLSVVALALMILSSSL